MYLIKPAELNAEQPGFMKTKNIRGSRQFIDALSFCFRVLFRFFSTTHCADKLPCRGHKQIQIHTDSYRIIDFLRLKVMFTVYNVEYCFNTTYLKRQGK